MQIDCLSFKETGYFSNLMVDYIESNEVLSPFYGEEPTLEGLGRQIELKKSFSNSHRKTLVDSLHKQYRDVKTSELVLFNIDSLSDNNTFTITTGHQLNLFTGPLYFLYKIISVINSCKQLKEKYPKNHFVPVYWMATEDHDFEEINYFILHGKKIQWNPEPKQEGAVGEFNNKGLDKVCNTLEAALGKSVNASYLANLFKEAYLNHKNLNEATRYLANALFKDEGLVVMDAHQKELKRELIPYIKNDVFEEITHKEVRLQMTELNKLNRNYPIQVNPREINYFYLSSGSRARIIKKGDVFELVDSNKSFSPTELENEIEQFPERFSPNVITRPLYQEVILPNLCYIGGGGELAYWLELKRSFDAQKVPFPVLMLRDSVLIMSEKQHQKTLKLGVSPSELFLDRNSLINKKIREISNIDIDFSEEKNWLNTHFKHLLDIATKTDTSFKGAVLAQEQKQLKGLKTLEKRLLKAQKRKLQDQVSRLATLQESLFPSGNLQERVLNFSELYLIYGPELIDQLLDHLDPFKRGFTLLKL
jgi:bacillithiol biosynthesis cysteine-adding enzyme BshC